MISAVASLHSRQVSVLAVVMIKRISKEVERKKNAYIMLHEYFLSYMNILD